MEEMVSSAVIQETVGQILSSLVQKYKEQEEPNANRNLERLEMAHIRLEAALETSDRWQCTDAALLRWRKKLKRAAEECDDTLHKCKQKILEGEKVEHEVRNSSFPRRIAHATKSFIFHAFSRNNGPSRSIVRRLEWYADGASDFLRFIELGGTPRCLIPFNAFIQNLFIGNVLQHKIHQGNKCTFIVLWIPFITAEHGIEVSLFFIQKDGNAPENKFYFSVMLQLSESTDIVGTAIKCLQLFTPLFKSTVEIIRNKLMQLPAQDLSWVPHFDSQQKEHWYNLHRFGTQWFRPDPLCCKKLDKHELCCNSKMWTSTLPDVSLEPVIEVNLQCHISPSASGKMSLQPQDPRRFIAGLHFMPHGSSEEQLPSAVAVIGGEEQHCLHTNITLEQLEEIMLQNAIHHFRSNAEATVYQMLWKSKHNTAYIQVEKACTETPSTGILIQGGRKRKFSQKQVKPCATTRFLSMWVAQAPMWLQGSIVNWVRKEAPEILNHCATWINNGKIEK